MSYLISFQYFALTPDIASSARDRVLIDKMCLWIYYCGMAAHIWWIIHAWASWDFDAGAVHEHCVSI